MSKLLHQVEAIEKTGGKAITKPRKEGSFPSLPPKVPLPKNRNILLKSFGGTVRARSKAGRISETVIRLRIPSPLVNLSHYEDQCCDKPRLVSNF